jgi:hypothetical protein
MPKQDIEKLVGMMDQLDPKDAEIVKMLAEKYGVPTEYAEAPAVEEAVKPADPTMIQAPSPEAAVVGAGQPLPPAATPVEAVQTEQAPALPVEGEAPAEVVEAETEPAPVAPAQPEMMPKASPQDEVKMMVSELGSQLAALKTEIEALKSTLEQVAVREPVTEQEVNMMEAKKQNVGQRIKGQPANIPDKNVMNDLIKKLGGLSK